MVVLLATVGAFFIVGIATTRWGYVHFVNGFIIKVGGEGSGYDEDD